MKDSDKSTQPEEEVIEKKTKTIKKAVDSVEPNPQIPSKLFVSKLKEEFKGEQLPKNIFNAFQKIVPPVDTEENYRSVWENTFKRQ